MNFHLCLASQEHLYHHILSIVLQYFVYIPQNSTLEEKDSLIELLILQCTDEALDYTHREEYCSGMQSIIEQMVVYRYNLIGTEGLKSESYSGISYSYNQEYPDNIIRMLKKYRRIVTL